MIIIKHWRIEGTLQYYLPHMALVGKHHFQKRGNMKKIGKWNLQFPDFLKNGEYNLWNQRCIFSSYLSIYQSRTRYRRDWDSNPAKLKSLIPKWMGFLAILGLFRSERVKRGEGRSGCKNPEFPPGTPNIKLEPQICSLLKLFYFTKIFSKMNEKYVTYFGDNFLIIYNKKKWKKK